MLTRAALIAAATISAGGLIAPLLRQTNSEAEVRRGIEHYRNKRIDAAIESFAAVEKTKATALTSFNTGTAQVAAGKLAEGAEHLARASKDPALAAAAFYNRGNGALAANQLDPAIQDYVAALRVHPGDRDAKRNLEIALLRRQSTRRSQPQQQQSQPDAQQPDDPQQQEPKPSQSGGDQKRETDAEALLRSVEQQEREELSRMRQMRPDPKRVGW